MGDYLPHAVLLLIIPKISCGLDESGVSSFLESFRFYLVA